MAPAVYQRQVLFCYDSFKENKRLLFPPFSLYLCSVSISPAFLRSFNALRVVDSESFRSFAMVGIDGQQLSFFPARSARYMYTDIALWGRSIRYSFVTLIIKSTPFFMQAPRFWSLLLFILQIQLCRCTQMRYRPVCQRRLDSCFRCSHGRVGTQNRPFQFPLPCIVHRSCSLVRHL